MAAVSNPNLSYSLPPPPSTSPQTKGLKKVLSGRRRSSEARSETGGRASLDELALEKSATLHSTRSSPSRDGSSKSGGSGIRKLVPGHEKRQRRRRIEEEVREAAETEVRGRTPEVSPTGLPPATNRSNSSLLTDTSEHDTRPSLMSRDSHTGYLTTSSPLMKVVGEGHTRSESDSVLYNNSVEAFPIIVEPSPPPTLESSPKATPKLGSTPILTTHGLIDKADTLHVDDKDDRRSSFNRLRGKSPARKIKEAFSKPGRSPRASPERGSTQSLDINLTNTGQKSPTIAERRQVETTMKQAPISLRSDLTSNTPSESSDKALSQLETSLVPPRTPPSGTLTTPITTVTPPTPTEKSRDSITYSEQDHKNGSEPSAGVVSASGNMISHRRVRSTSSVTHGKSKLSNTMNAPLTPTLEEVKTPTERTTASRNFTPGGSFFSNWVSAAQNAATTLTNFTAQNRSRSGTTDSDPAKPQLPEDASKSDQDTSEQSAAKRKLAVETLGSGELDFSHFNLDGPNGDKSGSSSRVDVAGLKIETDFKHDEEQAKIEDVEAQRAVSAAYEKPGVSTPVAEIQDPIVSLRHTQTVDSTATGGTLTPPNGSVFEGETGPVKRSNSVRSKLANRRSRGSSIATGQSTIGAIIGASTTTLANPALIPKVAGFTPAPKARNRAFHQQFRSVPEDDSLIEDYSCALQKEILLAGRIYISEGHICFSSNILGWVTTLIISFEEVVSIERENTAMIIPNAIAVQTLHARHTFRSLLSREATFDLIIGIWKVNHPASFQKSVNGKQLVAEQAQKIEAEKVVTNGDSAEASDESDDDDSASDDDENNDDDGSARSITGSNASAVGSDVVDAKSVARKPSGTIGAPGPTISNTVNGTSGEMAAAAAIIAGVPAVVDFPGPATHAPTDCTDSSTHYEKVIKDEVISAPLGKIYSLLYGPQSGAFVRKYLVDECKCTDVALEDDKKGLNNENKSRQYSYIKPLAGPVGPKQTKCITTEALDFFDLEKSVSVTCTTQTPDVPSGNVFSTKTRYCLSWAPGNATRLQMNCTIEWTGKSWIKSMIEKGANDGQQQYGDGLMKALKSALGRSRATTVGSKGLKIKKKRKGERKGKGEKVEENASTVKNWGPLEPVRPILEPVVDIVSPIFRVEVVVAILSIMVLLMWFRQGDSGGQLGQTGSYLSNVQKRTAYEEMWQHEESELWRWLEDRAGLKTVMSDGGSTANSDHDMVKKQQARKRKQQLNGRDVTAKMRAENWSQTELQEAVKVTRERLDKIQQMMDDKVV